VSHDVSVDVSVDVFNDMLEVYLVGLLGTAEWFGGSPGRSLLMKAAQLTCSMSQCSITCSMPAPFSRSTRTPLLYRIMSCSAHPTDSGKSFRSTTMYQPQVLVQAVHDNR